MAKINLEEKNKSAHNDFNPVELSENVSVEPSRDVKNGYYAVEGNIMRNEKNIGRFVYDETGNRLFVNVSIDDLSRNTRRSIVEAVADIILGLVPEETTEETAE